MWSTLTATGAHVQTGTYNPRVPNQIHVEEFGAGAPLIAIHGFGASIYTWRHVRNVLAESHHVYAIDLKGSGQAPKPQDGRYSMRDQAEQILALIDERKLTGVTLVGHSFGGGVALVTAVELIRTRPGILHSLILLAAPAYPQTFPWFIRSLRMPLIGPALQALTPVNQQVRTVLRSAYYNDDLIPADSVAAYAAPLRMAGGRAALRATALQIVPPDIEDLITHYPRIDVPTLLIWGADDEIVPLSSGERLQRTIPGATLKVFDAAGHVPHEEAPELVRPVLREFLRRVGSQDASGF